ncbi:hypothetical protein Dhaf_4834 [Desulfitobacterium hafniense DCB-2]|uniref:Uncharacterized protein n=2 Tax=root TaxID=1 RepID=B8FZ77_DESHD|nr:hypothetical protein Dhaf_4834 [Desulfitobacterium hafniense DCB-2]
MSNTGRMAIDDNAVIRKFNRRKGKDLGVTEY